MMWRRRHLPAALLLTVGIAMSVGGFVLLRSLEEDRLQGDFDLDATALAASLTSAIEVSVDDVEFVATLFSAFGVPTPEPECIQTPVRPEIEKARRDRDARST